MVRNTRRVRRGRSLMDKRPPVQRDGKKRDEIERYLLDHGGSATIAELMAVFAGEKTRKRDFVRRQLAPLAGAVRSYQGTPLSVGPPTIEVAGDVVRLLEGWQEARDQRRALGEEEEAARRQKTDHLIQRAAYRARKQSPEAEPAPTEEEMDEAREERERRQRSSRRKRIEFLVRQGMQPEGATRAVIPCADGFVEDLHKIEGAHPLECECAECAVREPRYVRLSEEIGSAKLGRRE